MPRAPKAPGHRLSGQHNWDTSERRKSLPPGWPSIRVRIFERDGYRCQLRYLGCTVTAAAVDHIVPVSLGGGDEDDNLQSACAGCHREKTAREAAEARHRLRDAY